MKTIGNILWLLLGGLLMSLVLFLGGVFLLITIIGIPFGLQLIKIAKFILWPFGKEVTVRFEKHPIMNLLWMVTGGVSMAVGHLIAVVIFGITIIGIPFAKQHLKLIPLTLFPFGATF